MGPSQGSPDGIVDFLRAELDKLTCRLGVQFRDPLLPPPSLDSLLPARYVRVQVASPPPPRVDKTRWDEGLQDGGGRPFSPGRPPTDGVVNPLKGIAPLTQPDPSTIVLDRWLALPAVSLTRALTRTFAFGSANPALTPLSFLSTFYPQLSINGTPITVAGVTYYAEKELVFDRPVDVDNDGEWVAVSLERFFPPERPSADYIVNVGGNHTKPVPAGVAPVFTAAASESTSTDATSASQSSPESG
jgi:hypothetical protein